MLPVRIILKSAIKLVDDTNNLIDCSTVTCGPNIYPTTNILSLFIWSLSVVLLIAIFLCVRLHKKSHTKRAAKLLIIPIAFVFFPATIATIIAIAVTVPDLPRVAKSELLPEASFIAISGFYLCLSGYALRYIYKRGCTR